MQINFYIWNFKINIFKKHIDNAKSLYLKNSKISYRPSCTRYRAKERSQNLYSLLEFRLKDAAI